ncbi:MAG: beta-ketoacyl synthase chain length factor [Burkholderiales bacterium]
MNKIFVQGVGIVAPGLAGWSASRALLAGLEPYREAPLARLAPDILPATERRRGSEIVKLAVTVAQEAMNRGSFPFNGVATVFASSDGDGQTLHHICEALAAPARDVSPTRFHNSVHNAAAGYWSIATGSKLPSNSLCAFDASFAAGLLDAASQVVVEATPVLLVVFDLPFPAPLHALRPVKNGFAAAFLLSPAAMPDTLGSLEISLGNGTATPVPEFLRAVFDGNPAARCLPLLQCLARKQEAVTALAYLSGSNVMVKYQP